MNKKLEFDLRNNDFEAINIQKRIILQEIECSPHLNSALHGIGSGVYILRGGRGSGTTMFVDQILDVEKRFIHIEGGNRLSSEIIDDVEDYVVDNKLIHIVDLYLEKELGDSSLFIDTLSKIAHKNSVSILLTIKSLNPSEIKDIRQLVDVDMKIQRINDKLFVLWLIKNRFGFHDIGMAYDFGFNNNIRYFKESGIISPHKR